jgi:hypothetical protein
LKGFIRKIINRRIEVKGSNPAAVGFLSDIYLSGFRDFVQILEELNLLFPLSDLGQSPGFGKLATSIGGKKDIFPGACPFNHCPSFLKIGFPFESVHGKSQEPT